MGWDQVSYQLYLILSLHSALDLTGWRLSVILAFNGARLAPILAWRLLRSAGFAVLFRAAARLLGLGTGRARNRGFVCSRLGLRYQ